MAQTDPHTEKAAKRPIPPFPPTAFVEIGKQRLDATIAIQAELFDKFREMNQAWLARAQSEADLASELTNKLIAARSVPDATTAWQEWTSKRMNFLAEDGRRVVANGQTAVEACTRLCYGGWSGGGST